MEISLEERVHIWIGCLQTLRCTYKQVSKERIEVSTDFLDAIQKVLEECEERFSKEEHKWML